jgi:hypothetical protein
MRAAGYRQDKRMVTGKFVEAVLEFPENGFLLGIRKAEVKMAWQG